MSGRPQLFLPLLNVALLTLAAITMPRASHRGVRNASQTIALIASLQKATPYRRLS